MTNDRLIHLPETAYTTEVEPAVTADGTVLWGARHPDLPGCVAQGATVEEAIQRLSYGFQDVVEYYAEHQLPMPEPRAHAPRMVIWQETLHPLAQQPSSHIVFGITGDSPAESKVRLGVA